jgi:hypothetical protein
MSNTIEKRIAKYQAWRLRQPVDAPMIGLLWEPDIPPLAEFLDRVGIGAEVSAEDIDPDMFLPHIDRWYHRSLELPGDVIQRFTPAFGVPWMEAIAGCPVVAHPGSLWAAPCLSDYKNRRRVEFSRNNPWLRKLLDCTRAIVQFAAGRFPVAVPQMRGPLDILAAMRTPASMCLDLLESPAEVHSVIAELAELWIAVGNAVLADIPPFHRGYATRMGMWAPGPALSLQNDVSTLVSAQTYLEFAWPSDRKITHRFPYSDFHMHSSEHHQIDGLLKLEQLTAIQLTLEHTLGGPSLDALIPVARRILGAKPLLLVCLDHASADRCLEELPAAGLCVMVASNERDIPYGSESGIPFRSWGRRLKQD